MTRRIYLIDCPGVVPPNPSDTDADILLRGGVRVENVKNPAQYVATMLDRCQKRHIERTYGIKDWKDEEDFLDLLARKSGRLLKGGEADQDAVARTVLQDFLRGRVPWFVPPPSLGHEAEGQVGREGRLGEMRLGNHKRKRDETDLASHAETADDGLEDGEGFEGFDDNDDDDISSLDDDDSSEGSELGEPTELTEGFAVLKSEAKIASSDQLSDSTEDTKGSKKQKLDS
jgi:nuclear GTP-binding protein